jgi:dTDP-glucose pyrophosphorylase/CBS domain-containing protein
MLSIEDHLISSGDNIISALRMIDRHPQNRTLFVHKDKRVIGSLTDGDIRRGLIRGLQLGDKVDKFMCRDFHFFNQNKTNAREIRALKNKGINLLPVLNAGMEIIKIYNLNKLYSILPLDAVLMAGGRGERLRPLTDKVPKSMLPLGKKPLMEYLVKRLMDYGIEDIHISVNYMAEKIINHFGDGSDRQVNFHYIKEKNPLGTIGSLSLGEDFGNENILVLNGDLFTNIDLEDLYFAHVENQADISVASVPYSVNVPYAIFQEEENRIRLLHEKPNHTYYANAGIYILRQELLKQIKKNVPLNATDFINAMIKKGKKIIQNPIVGYWIDIGSPEDFRKAEEIIKHI